MTEDILEGTTNHPANKNKKKEILVSVWDFGAIRPQAEREHYVCSDHPAKMRPSLAKAILQIYGESPVFDPMAGIGTTLVEAMLRGTDSIGVEFERKFVDQANKNIEHVKSVNTSNHLGRAVCIQGDARDLSHLSDDFNKENVGGKKDSGLFGSVIFSPPFGEANKGSGIAKKGYEGKYGRDEELKDRCDRALSQDESNISNLCHSGTYLEEMFKVYGECYRVLKPGKFMVVVVRDIRRRGLTIPLGADTIKLCQTAGFKVFDVIINKIRSPSFWQLNRAKKDQERGINHPLRTHEYVLVFKK